MNNEDNCAGVGNGGAGETAGPMPEAEFLACTHNGVKAFVAGLVDNIDVWQDEHIEFVAICTYMTTKMSTTC